MSLPAEQTPLLLFWDTSYGSLTPSMKFKFFPLLQQWCSCLTQLCLHSHPATNSLRCPGLPRPVFHTDELMDWLEARDWLQAKQLTDLRATFCHNSLFDWRTADTWALHVGILKGCRDSPRQLLQCFVQYVSLNVLISVLSIVSQSDPTGELIQSSVGKPRENSL